MKLALCLLFVMVLLLFLPINTVALINARASLHANDERMEEIGRATQEVNSADKIPVQLYDGKYFAFSPTVSVMFVKTGDSVKGLVYHPGATKGYCIFGAINNTTQVMDVWEIYSLPIQHIGDIVQIKLNGEERSFDLEMMGVKTKNQFEQHYKAMGYDTLWQDIWKEFTDCGNFFSLLNV